MLIKPLIVFGLLLLISANMSFAQSGTGEGGSPTTQAQEPVEVMQPAYRWFFWPDEEPENFNLSTMGHGNSGTTMGEKTSRRSNLEVNPMGDSETEENQPVDDQVEQPVEDEFEDINAVPPARPPSDNPVVKWVDEEGNIHITNEPRNVPEDQLE